MVALSVSRSYRNLLILSRSFECVTNYPCYCMYDARQNEKKTGPDIIEKHKASDKMYIYAPDWTDQTKL